MLFPSIQSLKITTPDGALMHGLRMGNDPIPLLLIPGAGDGKSTAQQAKLALALYLRPRFHTYTITYLMTADPPVQANRAIIEGLSASKGAISLTTRQLMDLGLIERLGVPGERQDHYRLKAGAWEALLLKGTQGATAMRLLAERGLAVTSNAPAAQRQLHEMRDLYGFIEQEYPKLLERWQQKRKAQEKAASTRED